MLVPLMWIGELKICEWIEHDVQNVSFLLQKNGQILDQNKTFLEISQHPLCKQYPLKMVSSSSCVLPLSCVTILVENTV